MSTSAALHRAERLLPGLLALGMSAFVAAVVTTINTGLDTGLPLRWLRAWTLAAPAAVVAAYVLRPLAWRVALVLAGARRSSALDPATPAGDKREPVADDST